jgi:hypothetical protein
MKPHTRGRISTATFKWRAQLRKQEVNVCHIAYVGSLQPLIGATRTSYRFLINRRKQHVLKSRKHLKALHSKYVLVPEDKAANMLLGGGS